MPAFLSTRMAACGEGGFTTYEFTGNTTNWTIPTTNGRPALVVRITATSDITLGGPIPTLTDQRLILYVQPDSPGTVTLLHEDSSTTAINRIATPTGGILRLQQGQWVMLTRQYTDDSTTLRWTIAGGTAPAYDTTQGTAQSISTTEDDLVLDDPAAIVPLTTSGDSTITGLTWPVPGPPEITFINTDTSDFITLPSKDGDSATANQWHTPGDVDLVIPPGGMWRARNNPGVGIRITGGNAVSTPAAISLPQLSTAPGTPPSGKNTVYANDDGGIAHVTPAGDALPVALTPGTSDGGEGYLPLPDTTSANVPTAATDALNLYSEDGEVKAKDDTGNVTTLAQVATSPPTTASLTVTPTWFLVKTITHADLTDANTTQDVATYTLPAKAALHGALVRTKTVGSGGGVGSLSLDLLLAGTGSGGAACDGLSANALGGVTGPGFTRNLYVSSWASTSALVTRFTADVDVADLTGGEWEVYLLLSTL